MLRIVQTIFGSKNDREIKRLLKRVKEINALEKQMQSMQDTDFARKTAEYKDKIKNKETTLDALLPEAFALVREAGKRILNMRHFDVQLIGGIVLHEGKIAEMRTGEGKTLVATLAVYLNALSGEGVHVVTVNEYLARRDSVWMSKLYNFLGLAVGTIYSFQDMEDKRSAYNADITYGTNNEFGFDYLRDNMAFSLADKVQRKLNFAVIDEVDSILIDEARTPLIISGQAEDSSELYVAINKFPSHLIKQEENEAAEIIKEGHYKFDEKTRNIELTESGHLYIEKMLESEGLLPKGESLYSPHNLSLLTHVYSALRAHIAFHKNIEYVVQNGQVVLIDEHTGRQMHGRRLSEGLHQAIEAKEKLQIQPETQTMASTTFQNYFRIYKKLSGMTGTADTEAFEFRHIYGLDVVVIPTNQSIVRIDMNDTIFLTKEEKYNAIIEDVKEKMSQGRPVLVGTTNIDTSEYLSSLLIKANIEHNVLNAKQHDKEAHIIAQAGKRSVVTIATNMAGRGTDIMLGGSLEAELSAAREKIMEGSAPSLTEDQVIEEWNSRHEEVKNAGGLHVIASERHESRRIDNQLRGRAGRQGDPGSSHFYLSMEDDLMRIFAGDRVRNMMRSLGLQNGESIEHSIVTNSIEKAQKKIEERNFDIRKQLLEYDDVANEQRRVIYSLRNDLLNKGDISDMKEIIDELRFEVANDIISTYIPPASIPDMWDISGLEKALENEFTLKLPVQQWLDNDKVLYEETLRDKIVSHLTDAYKMRESHIGAETLRSFERQLMLQMLDESWKEHLARMDQLRQGIHLRGYAQKNPKQEYKRESFELFQSMLMEFRKKTIKMLSIATSQPLETRDINDTEAPEASVYNKAEGLAEYTEPLHLSTENHMNNTNYVNLPISRNDLCPCGSGKKYKRCHGKIS